MSPPSSAVCLLQPVMAQEACLIKGALQQFFPLLNLSAQEPRAVGESSLLAVVRWTPSRFARESRWCVRFGGTQRSRGGLKEGEARLAAGDHSQACTPLAGAQARRTPHYPDIPEEAGASKLNWPTFQEEREPSQQQVPGLQCAEGLHRGDGEASHREAVRARPGTMAGCCVSVQLPARRVDEMGLLATGFGFVSGKEYIESGFYNNEGARALTRATRISSRAPERLSLAPSAAGLSHQPFAFRGADLCSCSWPSMLRAVFFLPALARRACRTSVGGTVGLARPVDRVVAPAPHAPACLAPQNARADKALTYPRMLRHRIFHTKTVEEMEQEAKKSSGGVELKRTLGWLDLTALGVGFMCGAGESPRACIVSTQLDADTVGPGHWLTSAVRRARPAGIFVSPGYIASALTVSKQPLQRTSAAMRTARRCSLSQRPKHARLALCAPRRAQRCASRTWWPPSAPTSVPFATPR